jgi:hypothetical protein
MTWADDAVAKLGPWWTVDFETYMRAIMSMASEVETYAEDVYDEDGNLVTPGWAIMLDPNNCPVEGLPYLAQWVGERLPNGITEAAARQWILDAPNQWRGTPRAIARAAQRWLTGSQLVQIRPRSKLDGTTNSDWLAIQVFEGDCPDSALVLAELRKVVPADIMVDFQVTPGATWEDAATGYSSWGALSSAYATWADLAAAAGFTGWAR